MQKLFLSGLCTLWVVKSWCRVSSTLTSDSQKAGWLHVESSPLIAGGALDNIPFTWQAMMENECDREQVYGAGKLQWERQRMSFSMDRLCKEIFENRSVGWL